MFGCCSPILTVPFTNNDYWSIRLILHKAWCGFDRTNTVVVWERGVLWIVTFCPEEPMGWCLAAEEVKGKGCGYRKCLSEVLYPLCPGYICNIFNSCAVLPLTLALGAPWVGQREAVAYRSNTMSLLLFTITHGRWVHPNSYLQDPRCARTCCFYKLIAGCFFVLILWALCFYLFFIILRWL